MYISCIEGRKESQIRRQRKREWQEGMKWQRWRKIWELVREVRMSNLIIIIIKYIYTHRFEQSINLNLVGSCIDEAIRKRINALTSRKTSFTLQCRRASCKQCTRSPDSRTSIVVGMIWRWCLEMLPTAWQLTAHFCLGLRFREQRNWEEAGDYISQIARTNNKISITF